MPCVTTIDADSGCCRRLIERLLTWIARPRTTGKREPARHHAEHPLTFENPDTYARWYRNQKPAEPDRS